MIRRLPQDARASSVADRPELLLGDTTWLDRLREIERTSPFGRLGRFQVFSEIGRGGQGVVYRAHDPETGEVVAVKRLHPARGDRRQVLHQIETEMRAVRALSHPNVVRTRGVEADGANLLLVMDWVDGVPLTEWASRDGERRTHTEIVALVARIAEIMAHAHERGVIHRDLKPTNVLVDGSGQPHLLDFGMARLDLETSMTTAASTRFVGTLAYAPPELVEGGSGAVEARSDLYSLGVSFYEMLEGRLPCDLGQSISSAVQAILHAEPRPLSGLLRDAKLQVILHRLLAKRPDDRYASAAALLADLQRYLGGERLSGDAMPARLAKARPRGPMLAAWTGVAGAAVLVTLLAGAALDRERRASEARAPERAGEALRAAGLTAEELGPWSTSDPDQVLAQASRAVSRTLEREPAAELRARIRLSRNFASLGLWSESAGETRRAIRLIEGRGGKGSADHAVAAALLDAARLGPSDPQAAAQHYREAAARIPAALQSGRGWLELLDVYARDQVARGRADDAVRAVDRAADLARRLPEAPAATRIQAFETRGLILTMLERWPAAEQAYREAISAREGRLDVGLPAAWSNLGSTLLRQGRPGEALEHYREAAALRCDYLYGRMPDAPEFSAMAKALRRDGLNPAHLLAMGRLLQKRAPEFESALLFTARRAAEAEAQLGRISAASGMREAIREIESGEPRATNIRG